MPDPSATLRQMLLADAEFDLPRIRALCLQITAGMADQREAARLHQELVDEVGLLEGLLDLASALEPRPVGLRDDALAALDRVVNAAWG